MGTLPVDAKVAWGDRHALSLGHIDGLGKFRGFDRTNIVLALLLVEVLIIDAQLPLDLLDLVLARPAVRGPSGDVNRACFGSLSLSPSQCALLVLRRCDRSGRAASHFTPHWSTVHSLHHDLRLLWLAVSNYLCVVVDTLSGHLLLEHLVALVDLSTGLVDDRF